MIPAALPLPNSLTVEQPNSLLMVPQSDAAGRIRANLACFLVVFSSSALDHAITRGIQRVQEMPAYLFNALIAATLRCGRHQCLADLRQQCNGVRMSFVGNRGPV